MLKKVALIVAAATLFVAAIEDPAHSGERTKAEIINENLGTISAASVNCGMKLTVAVTVLADVAFQVNRDDYTKGSVKFYELGLKEGWSTACAVVAQAFDTAFATGE